MSNESDLKKPLAMFPEEEITLKDVLEKGVMIWRVTDSGKCAGVLLPDSDNDDTAETEKENRHDD